MQIKFARKFKKQYDKADYKIKKAFDKRLELFSLDPFYPLLDNHTLTGQLAGKRSIDITGNWRAIYSEAENIVGERIVTFELLGTHSQLYK